MLARNSRTPIDFWLAQPLTELYQWRIVNNDFMQEIYGKPDDK